jgi:hypothetical protein
MLGVAAALLTFVGACSSGGCRTASPATGTTTTSVPTATVQQVASIVAQHKVELGRILANETTCASAVLDAINTKAFDNTDRPSVETSAEATVCNTMLTSLSSAVESLTADLGAVKPPQEVSELTSGTLDAARTLSDEADVLAACIPSSPTSNDAISNCTSVDSFTTDADAMKAKLAGWSPYGA